MNSRLFAVLVSILICSFYFQRLCYAAQATLATPTGLTVTPGDTKAVLSWTPVAGAATYHVYHSTNASLTIGNSSKVGNPGGTTFTDGGLTNGTKYYWIVTAVDSSDVESLASQTASGIPTQGTSQTQGTNPPSTNIPSTNVGATTKSNVQNPVLNLNPIPPDQVPTTLSEKAGSLSWSDDATSKLVKNACDSKVRGNPSPLPSFDNPSTYALINVLRLGDLGPGTQAVESSNWYVYSKQRHWYRGWIKGWGLSDFDGSTRMYGAEKVVLISILLNDQNTASPDVTYKITVTKQQPTNIADVYALLGVVFPAAATPAPQNQNVNFWGCSIVPIAYKTSSLKTDTTLSSGASSPFTASVTFINEPKEWWDVSFALPVTKVNSLQYNSTAGTVTPTQINKQSLFAVVDLYVPPTNLSATSYNLIPHPFVGVAMNSQPLHSLLFGVSMGLHLAEVYAGAVLVKQQQLSGLSSGSAATPAQLSSANSYGYKASFSFGIKISIKAAVKAFSSSKSK